MDPKELKKWKQVHDLLVKIRVGQIKNNDKEQNKEIRIKKIKTEAKKEWLDFVEKYI